MRYNIRMSLFLTLIISLMLPLAALDIMPQDISSILNEQATERRKNNV